MFCTACGTENPAGSRYCANCGAVLAESLPDTTSVIGSHVTVPESDGEFSTEAHQGAIDALAPGSAFGPGMMGDATDGAAMQTQCDEMHDAVHGTDASPAPSGNPQPSGSPSAHDLHHPNQ